MRQERIHQTHATPVAGGHPEPIEYRVNSPCASDDDRNAKTGVIKPDLQLREINYIRYTNTHPLEYRFRVAGMVTHSSMHIHGRRESES